MAVYLQPDKVTAIFGAKLNEYIITNHNINKIDMPVKRTKKLKGITIHNTDWITVNAATTPAEQYTRACVNGNLNTVRVHYYVDNKCIWQNLPDDWEGWHAADGRGDGNTTTISIECIMRNSYNSESLKSRDNCARLTAYLCNKYGLTTNDIYTHTYWLHVRDKDSVSKCGDKDKICTTKHSYKTCPLYIIPAWQEFLNLVTKYIEALGGKTEVAENKNVAAATTKTSSTFQSYKVKILDNTLNVRKAAGVNNPVTCIVKKGEVYTIVDETTVKNNDGSTAKWGKLKFGAGWINVGNKYVKKS